MKEYADHADKIKKQMDDVLDEFQKSSKMILAQIQLASDNYKGTVLTESNKKNGFKNMDDVRPNTSKNPNAFTTVNSAYNGQMNLEGFSTESDSAYLNATNLFTLEENVITKLKDFNVKYYDYQTCLKNKNYESGSCRTATSSEGGLDAIETAKTAVISAINAFNTAITAMGLKQSLTPGATPSSTTKISQAEFVSRHKQIKSTANRVSELRSELDMKMSMLLNKSKGPLPEAQNKYNTENYVAIGWTILATSMIYYVFVEMK